MVLVCAQRVGNDTALAGIIRLVTLAQTGKARVQAMADRVARVFVPFVIGLGALTFLGYFYPTTKPD